jgi:hypothetical protein
VNHAHLSQNCFLRPQAECPTHIQRALKYPSCRKAQDPFPRKGVWTGSSDVGGSADTSTSSQSLSCLSANCRSAAITDACLLDSVQDLRLHHWVAGVFPFKMIRRHRERGCSLGDGDCLCLKHDGRDGIHQSRQSRKLHRRQKTCSLMFCKSISTACPRIRKLHMTSNLRKLPSTPRRDIANPLTNR